MYVNQISLVLPYYLTLLLDAGIEASACARKSTTSTSTSIVHTIGCARPLAYYLAAMVVLIEAGGFYSRIYGKIINRTSILQHDILLYIDPSLLPAAKPFAGHRADV